MSLAEKILWIVGILVTIVSLIMRFTTLAEYAISVSFAACLIITACLIWGGIRKSRQSK